MDRRSSSFSATAGQSQRAAFVARWQRPAISGPTPWRSSLKTSSRQSTRLTFCGLARPAPPHRLHGAASGGGGAAGSVAAHKSAPSMAWRWPR
eukprot:2288997-Prymnesium_polylepis.1